MRIGFKCKYMLVKTYLYTWPNTENTLNQALTPLKFPQYSNTGNFLLQISVYSPFDSTLVIDTATLGFSAIITTLIPPFLDSSALSLSIISGMSCFKLLRYSCCESSVTSTLSRNSQLNLQSIRS